MPKRNNHNIGAWAEDIVNKFLVSQGYEILEENFRTRTGEIDIIARDNEYISFVEVKYRRNLEYGYPREAVNYYKQQKIYKTALYYIATRKLDRQSFRFDVVEVLGNIDNYNINIIKNAFGI